jgi:membrane protein required for colicin V production
LIDLIIIIVLMTSALLGYWTGLVVQVVRLVSIVLSAALAFIYGDRIATFIVGTGEIPANSVFFFLCPLAIFILSLMGCYLVAYMFSGLLKSTDLGQGDRVAGALFGLFKAVILVGVVAVSSVLQVSEGSPWRQRVAHSWLARGSAVCAYILVWALPEDVQQKAPGGGELTWPVLAAETQSAEQARDGGPGPS